MESIDDAWADGTDETSPPSQRVRARIKRVLIAGGHYLFDALIFALFAYVGHLDIQLPLWYAAGGLAVTALFVFLHWSGLAEKYSDPDMVIEQMAVALGVQLVCLYFVPLLTMYFLGLMFVIFSFGISRLSLEQTLALWLLNAAAVGLVLYHHQFQIPPPGGTSLEGILTWIAFCGLLLRGVGISFYMNLARQRGFARSLQLAQEAESAKALVAHDALTGALNRHAILPMIEHQIGLAGRSKEAFALCMLDLDHFRVVNEHFGQKTGDKVLGALVRIAKDVLRTSDQIGRYGGEEFVILLPGSSGHEAITVINRLRASVEHFNWSELATGLEVRISAGIAPFSPGDTVEKLLGKADYGLYKAKNSGRNRVVYVGGE